MSSIEKCLPKEEEQEPKWQIDKALLAFQTICLTIVACLSLRVAEIVLKKPENSQFYDHRRILGASFLFIATAITCLLLMINILVYISRSEETLVIFRSGLIAVAITCFPLMITVIIFVLIHSFSLTQKSSLPLAPSPHTHPLMQP